MLLSLHLDATHGLVFAQVHPMVLFSVLDHYLRRPENQKRVIGTLLGTVSANMVEITNSFAVPHLEKNDEVKRNFHSPNGNAVVNGSGDVWCRVTHWSSVGYLTGREIKQSGFG